jgi:hypothetical protein
LSIDFGFLVVGSKDQEQIWSLMGPEEEKCYVLTTNHYSCMLFGHCFVQKMLPSKYLDNWLHVMHPQIVNIPDKYVQMDLGSELSLSHKVDQVFKKYRYAVERTALNSSVMNAPIERAHQTVADGIRTLLGGANLELQYWTYAFYHYLKIYNRAPHGDDNISPYKKCTGIKPDFSKMRTFGCLVTILDNNKCKMGKADYLSCHGIFLGFTNTFKQIHYKDETGHIKTALHVIFDEA